MRVKYAYSSSRFYREKNLKKQCLVFVFSHPRAPKSRSFDQEALIAALDADLANSDEQPPLSGSLRRRVEEVILQALIHLSEVCTAKHAAPTSSGDGKPTTTASPSKQPKPKELTQLRRAHQEWQAFYTKVNPFEGKVVKSHLRSLVWLVFLLLFIQKGLFKGRGHLTSSACKVLMW